ncbi:Uncharacterised protein [Chlamydia trachomatis]|nr:Uncharacterised protein [Chlamydia trachomatis]
MHPRFEQRGERYLGVFEGLLQNARVEIVHVQNAHVAPEGSHIVDDLARSAFA